MNRKLIQLGKTLVVSLPCQIVEKLKLKKGQEIEVIDKDKEILIRQLTEKQQQELCINLKGYNERILKRALSATYKAGFEKLKILCDKNQIKHIEKYLDFYVGLILIEKGEDYILIKDVSDSAIGDFLPIFKKTFFILKQISSELLEKIRKSEKLELEEITERKTNTLKHINFCLKQLNKEGLQSLKETNVYFYMLSILNLINDSYFKLGKYYIKNKSFSKNTILFYNEVDNFLEKTHGFFFSNFNLKELYEIRESLIEKKKKNINEIPNIYLVFIAKLIRELIETKMIVNIIKKEAIE